jgi:hypothetical protein
VPALVLAAVGLAAQVALLWAWPYPPLLDLPNHAARHYLETLWLRGEHLPDFYTIRYQLLPNLGSDLTVPGLMLLLPPLTALKVFLSVSVLLYWAGPTLFVLRQAGPRAGAVVAALLLLPLNLNPFLFWGFLNFYSGLGLAFLALAHYCWLIEQPRARVGQWLLHAALVTLLFVWHLSAWGTYGAVMGCRMLAAAYDGYRSEQSLRAALRLLLASVLATVPSLVLCALYLRAGSAVSPAEHAMSRGWLVKLLRTPLLFRGYDNLPDVAVGLLWMAAVLLAFGPGLRRARGRGWLLLAVAVLAGFYLLIPYELGSTSDTDSRLLPPLFVCALAWLACVPVKWPRAALALAALCLLVRVGAVGYAWGRMATREQTYARAFDLFHPGSRVLPFVPVPEGERKPVERHFVCWAVLSREVFVPTLLAHRGQFPLTLNAPAPGCARDGERGPVLDADCARECYDYLWVYNPHGVPFAAPESFTKVFEADALTVWRRLAKPQAAQSRMSLTTLPWTSVSRKSRPWNLYVSRL